MLFIIILLLLSNIQVVLLHHILSKSTITSRPTVLWCYKKELGFSSHRKKRMKELKKKMKNGPMDKSVKSTLIF